MTAHRWDIVSGRMRWLSFCNRCFITRRTHRNSPKHKNRCPSA